jgi:hypothetical protein
VRAASYSAKKYWLAALALLVWLAATPPLAGQTRPLRTADAETLPPGWLRAEAGFDFLQEVTYPLSGLSGDQTSVGVIGLRLGVGRMVELQLEGAVRHFLDVRQQTGGFVTPVLSGPRSASDTGDFSIFTKVSLLKETPKRPGLAFRVGFQMPNSNQVRGIGSNTTNIFVSMILQKHFGPLNLMGNVGLGILQAPAANFTQNDVLTYGGAFTYRLDRRVNLVGEVAGFHSTRRVTSALLGTESRAQARLGLQVLAGGFHWDFAGIAGLTKNDPKTGFTFGVSREVRLFDYGAVK